MFLRDSQPPACQAQAVFYEVFLSEKGRKNISAFQAGAKESHPVPDPGGGGGERCHVDRRKKAFNRRQGK